MAEPESSSAPHPPPVTSVKLRLPNGQRASEKDIWNTSLGGVFIHMLEPLAFGTELSFEFVFAHGEPNIACSGYVVWSTREAPDRAPQRSGVGVRLVGLAIADMRRLARGVGQDL